MDDLLLLTTSHGENVSILFADADGGVERRQNPQRQTRRILHRLSQRPRQRLMPFQPIKCEVGRRRAFRHRLSRNSRKNSLRVLAACEFSGRVRDAFIALGHEAFSCDIVDSDSPGPHFKCDVFDVINQSWDLVIAFPPCTHLAASGARWWPSKIQEQGEAIEFVKELWRRGPAKMAIENPVGRLSSAWMKPSQIIQPWQFGHGETKSTCLWIRGLPLLQATKVVDGRNARIHWMGESKARQKQRSLTYQGVAEAMAQQWGAQ